MSKLDLKKLTMDIDKIMLNRKGLENLAMANAIFEGIKEYSFMHSSQQVTEAVIEAVRVSLPSIGQYIESRFLHVSNVFSSETQKCIK